MINAFKALFASIAILFTAFGRYAHAIDEIGKMTEEAAAAMADKARIDRARQLVELEKADRKIASVTKASA
jgi:hypothetical protein